MVVFVDKFKMIKKIFNTYPMAKLKKDIISVIVAIIAWLFVADNEPETIKESIIEESTQKCTKDNVIKECNIEIIALTYNNISKLDNGLWYVVMRDKYIEDNCRWMQQIVKFMKPNTSFGVALLTIDDFKTAELAAKLQIENSSDIIKYQNGVIFSKSGCREPKNSVSIFEIIDYYLFFNIIQMKRIFKDANIYCSYLSFIPSVIEGLISVVC